MARSKTPPPRRYRPMIAITLSADVDREVNARADRLNVARSRIIDEALRIALGLPEQKEPPRAA